MTTLLGLALARGVDPQNEQTTEPSGANPQRSLARLAELAGGTDVLAKPDNAKEKRPYLSPGVAEIVRMQESGLEGPVIQAYIENSTVLYRANADDLVYLHEHQVAPALITALIKRGAELRAQAAQKESQDRAAQQATAAAAAPSAAPPAYAAPTYVAPAQPAYPSYEAYPVSYPSYAYAAYPGYGYGYGGPSFVSFSGFHSFNRPFVHCNSRFVQPAFFHSSPFVSSVNFSFGHTRFCGTFPARRSCGTSFCRFH
jgi:hypothetical protein